jgi:hypothetical protein
MAKGEEESSDTAGQMERLEREPMKRSYSVEVSKIIL